MKLNPTKCSFGVTARKFLGYIVTQRGIEANPDEIRAILDLPSPKYVKEVQKLTGRVAALNRFVSRSSDKRHQFFTTLRKINNFDWTAECEEALQQLKEYLTSPPLLSKPKKNEQLYVYLTVSETAVSAVLVREEESKQLPVYYVRKSLLDVETRYSQMEKLTLALVTAAQKLRPYLQSHSIMVVTTFPMRNVLHKPELSGNQISGVADFVADFTPPIQDQAEKELFCIATPILGKWTLYVDGSSNVKGSGLGLVLISPEGSIIQRSVRCGFKATTNEAEYEALIAGLQLTEDMKIKNLVVHSDSQLIVNQLQGSYQAKDPKMASYLEAVKELQKQFDEFSLTLIPRVNNAHVDALVKLGSSIQTTEPQPIPVVYLKWPSVWKQYSTPEETMAIESAPPEEANEKGDDWMISIARYIQEGTLPDDRSEARRLQSKAARFTLFGGLLYKRSYSGPLLRCVTPKQAQYVLAELHEGECGNHSGGRSLTHRALSTGYY
ncbi:uncharacterized protein LOC120003565 [Tripterygium wilfordii]|uniref:uncharacterized protein LOC120003565 n=1 Tax=Tripterygium wilfordii TaxID=458696 RepID=UPI0018F812B2|nr:uncharacterized protein LOC120003565 [Tripterygium wilfordii]